MNPLVLLRRMNLMANKIDTSPFSRKSLIVALGVLAGLIWTQFSGSLTKSLFPNGIADLPYSRSFLASLSDIVVMGALVCLTADIGFGKLGKLSGLKAPMTLPFALYGVMFVTTGILCLFFAPFADTLSSSDILWRGIGAPITEEVVFRGLAIGALMMMAGWRFLPAALAPAIVFGLAHMTQETPFVESAGITAITGVGGLLFGWMFVRWGFNLWPAILAHIGLNSIWEVFALGDTALGGWFGNGLRLFLVFLLVISSLRFTPENYRNATRN